MNHCRLLKYNPDEGICSTHPHNLLIQIITELGLVGLCFFVIIFYFLLYQLIKKIRSGYSSKHDLPFYAISLGVIVNLFPLIPSGNFFNNWISINIYYNVGIYLYILNKYNQKKINS